MNFALLEKSLGVVFRDRSLLKQALTHKSYLNENRTWPLGQNERLEFLGDAVLELIVTEWLFGKFPRAPEGQMTEYRSSLVRIEVLSDLAGKIGLNDYLLLSRGEAKDTGRARDLILGNAVEAVIGAIYLDQGYEHTKNFVSKHVLSQANALIAQGESRNSKSRLQELVQARRRVTPIYKLLEQSGPDHAKQFLVGVYFGDELIAQGQGVAKQLAEEDAAEVALALPEWTQS
jgi:ribonuclease-3